MWPRVDGGSRTHRCVSVRLDLPTSWQAFRSERHESNAVAATWMAESVPTNHARAIACATVPSRIASRRPFRMGAANTTQRNTTLT